MDTPTPNEAPAEQTPPAATGTDAPQAPPASTAPETTDTATGNVDGLKSALEAERRAHREANAELARLRAAAKDAEDAQLSETERLQKEHAEYKAKVEQYEAEQAKTAALSALSKAAKDAGAGENADAVARLAEVAKYDADTDNAGDLIEAVKQGFPGLFVPAQPPAAPGLGSQDAGAGAGTKSTHFTREQVNAMSDEEYEANRADIFASMSSW